MVSTALLARIECLEAENDFLKASTSKQQPLRIAQIQHNDRLIRFYTGFTSYAIFLVFLEFLGPVIHKLNYWGSKEQRQRYRIRELDPMNQLFLLLIKLRCSLKGEDLAFCFEISASSVSRYITTWICSFQYLISQIANGKSLVHVQG